MGHFTREGGEKANGIFRLTIHVPETQIREASSGLHRVPSTTVLLRRARRVLVKPICYAEI